ncbi:hypothetical protein AXF42_Ash000824 [Apostasia shenzhenica]|uniref:Uncharacterized protein n=1 Tax=Apostasia shenzhenica TaxID=1088818 RepID=A0A2I0AT54_9ASPA|nr:hypothetical protein AXF42_Ash000824 [Apostasia shenzhenica]
MSAVIKQPSSEEERFKALQALLSCPTSSIHTEKPPKEIRDVQKTFPLPIDESTLPLILFQCRDDVADHDKWAEHLRCKRILHSQDRSPCIVKVEAFTADVEWKLYGSGPWSIGTDFELIHTPGHTEVRPLFNMF